MPEAGTLIENLPKNSISHLRERPLPGRTGQPNRAPYHACMPGVQTGNGRRPRPRSPAQPPKRPGVTRLFASVVHGLASVVVPELERVDGLKVTGVGFDGRSDLILFELTRASWDAVWSLRVIEDIFVEINRVDLGRGDRADRIARRIWQPEHAERALSVWAAQVRPLAAAMTYRVIARVLGEQDFLRTELRGEVTQAIGTARPRWHVTDPARLEIWVSEYRPGKLIAGLRLSDAAMRQHDGRVTERHGALRPTVAALMVSRAGPPARTLLDPCCGSGTILAEALAAGWSQATGIDIDRGAVSASAANVPQARVAQGDARSLSFPRACVEAVVSNLPFGRQYGVPGDRTNWLTAVLAEASRVTRPGGRVVALAPAIPERARPAALTIISAHPLRLLGRKTTMWVFDRGEGS